MRQGQTDWGATAMRGLMHSKCHSIMLKNGHVNGTET